MSVSDSPGPVYSDPRSASGAGRAGPLAGLNVIEMAGKGAAPFAAMLLADMGAEVIRIDRASAAGSPARDLVARSRRSISIDLKASSGTEAVLDLIANSDVLIEGYRPNVMERLGLGPDICLERNASLVYARSTGWGQNGPLAGKAGHDINYIAMSGALNLIGRAGAPPTPPLNLVGDLGGGGVLAAFGIVCALMARSSGAPGQVIDASMVDGSALLLTMFCGAPVRDSWRGRGSNIIDSGAPFYECYQTADDRWLAVGAIEPQFYEAFLTGLNVDAGEFYPQMDFDSWMRRKDIIRLRIKQHPLSYWLEVYEQLDACVSPVLDLNEAPLHPQNLSRQSYVDIAGAVQSAPSPRFSATPTDAPSGPPVVGQHTVQVLSAAGFGASRINALLDSGVAVQA
jgi:alpha-methylacyl-CoA racemase